MATDAATSTVRALHAMIDAAAGVLAEQSLESTLLEMARALERIVPYTSMAIYEVDWPNRLLLPVFANGEYVDATLAERPSLDDSITGTAVMRGEVVSLEAGHPLIAEHQMEDTEYSDREAFLVAPLMASSHVLGSFNIWREGDDDAHFTEEETELVRRFATLAAIAYANARQLERLRELALTDELTGLYNRRHLFAELGSELARAAREHGDLALVILDVDDFKSVNDRYGHPTGDAALKAVARALRGASRESDVVCRIGGEEFAIILPSTGASHTVRAAERLLEAVRTAPVPEGLRLTASAGVATASTDGADVDSLMRAADQRLLASKAGGKDRLTAGA